MEPGGLYSVEDGTGGYRIAKLFAWDSTTVHLRLYSNRFPARPDTVASGTLRLRPAPGEPVGREHFPAARYLFRAWSPQLVGHDTVTAQERGLVEEWRSSGGRVIGQQQP